MSSDTRLALCDVRGPLADLNEKLASENGEVWLAGLSKFLRRENPWEVPAFRYNKQKDGWKLQEGFDEAAPEGDIVPPLEAVSFLREGESWIGGDELVRRDRQELHCNGGQLFAEWLEKHQEQIPKELREYVLVFTKTIWRDSYGGRRVAYLDWYGGRWYLFFRYLGLSFHGGDRLVRPREGA